MIDRRTFIGAAAGMLAGCARGAGAPADSSIGAERGSDGVRRAATDEAGSSGGRSLDRIGIQLYSLRADARRDLEATIAGIAEIGYDDVELLASFDNFGASPAEMRAMLDRNGLRAPSTHIGSGALDDLDRALDDAATIGLEYLTIASLSMPEAPTLDDYRRWADRFNEAGRVARERDIWIAFHNHAGDQRPIDGHSPYEVFIERTDPAVVRHQLDTGNSAMAGIDPLTYVQRYGDRFWTYHIKDVPELGVARDTDLGQGVIDIPGLIAAIGDLTGRHFFVEQETYPDTPFESVRRDYVYMRSLRR